MFGECPLTGSGERQPARVCQGGIRLTRAGGHKNVRTQAAGSQPGIRAQGFGPCEETEQTGQRNRTHSRRGHDPIRI